ncbi:MAG TPA: methylaspartate ammonia-lyase [Bordetella sp.]
MNTSHDDTFSIARFRVDLGLGGYWINDQAAVQTSAKPDGFFFEGATSSPVFDAVRAPSLAYLISLELDDGRVAFGDCVTVANAGYAGRPAPLRRASAAALEAALNEQLTRRRYGGFREAAQVLQEISLPQAIELPARYGVSQALLDAAAQAKRTTMMRVLCDEYGLPVPTEPFGFAGSCGGAWEANVDKAIVRKVAMFPQSAIQTVAECERLPGYVTWIRERIDKWGGEGYLPDLHFDFHSSLGRMLDNDETRIIDYLAGICEKAGPCRVYFEDPVLSKGPAEAIERMGSLRAKLQARLENARLVADEWANGPGQVAAFAAAQASHAIQIKMPDNGSLLESIAAMQACKQHGVLAYLGGSCNETDISARASVHVGLAFGAWRMFTKPGLGFDEGLMIMANEVSRTLGRG